MLYAANFYNKASFIMASWHGDVVIMVMIKMTKIYIIQVSMFLLYGERRKRRRRMKKSGAMMEMSCELACVSCECPTLCAEDEDSGGLCQAGPQVPATAATVKERRERR